MEDAGKTKIGAFEAAEVIRAAKNASLTQEMLREIYFEKLCGQLGDVEQEYEQLAGAGDPQAVLNHALLSSVLAIADCKNVLNQKDCKAASVNGNKALKLIESVNDCNMPEVQFPDYLTRELYRSLGKMYARCALPDSPHQGEMLAESASYFRELGSQRTAEDDFSFASVLYDIDQLGIDQSDQDKALMVELFERYVGSEDGEEGARAAYYNLGICYLTGTGCKQDIGKAHDAIERAYALGLRFEAMDELRGRFKKKLFGGWDFR
ncbi:SEL1-like repeat protein [uncultured Adlercreutzia sp.]|uniref:SEL1-like repeat protein n=1 Tax=uncultured Adlercreutzia sp. TaxID=875803 RepID=UPI0026F3D9FB|nr:SEL1-like repeat protein [uncultured Adlercreutzia sp.]